MNDIRIAAIVEGHGEVESVPILIRRIANETGIYDLKIDPVLRVPSTRLRRQGELERTIEQAARKLGGPGSILILLDCDWDNCCPAHEAPLLSQQARRARPDLDISVVLANKEYEAWFIAAANSLRGAGKLAADLPRVENPEEIRGAKEWLGRQMAAPGGYAETLDQPAFTSCFNLDEARSAPSFDKFYREITRMLTMTNP